VAKPVVVVADRIFPGSDTGKPVPVNLLFTASDPAGQPIVSYSFRNAAGAGYFTYNGTTYQGNELSNVPAADLAKVSYVPIAPAGSVKYVAPRFVPPVRGAGGRPVATALASALTSAQPLASSSRAALPAARPAAQPAALPTVLNPFLPGWKGANPGLADAIEISASDGTTPSDWAKATWTTRANWTPDVRLFPRSFLHNQAGKPQPVSGLFWASDQDRDPIVFYRFTDAGTDPASGYFTYKGVSYQGKALPDVPASDLAQVSYVPGISGKPDKISIVVSDGIATSDAVTVTWQTSPNNKPVVNNSNQVFATATTGKAVPVRTLFSVTDADYDPIVWYNFFDANPKPESGFFRYKGVDYQGKQLNQVMAVDLDQLSYVVGKPGQMEEIQIGACDGPSNSDWAKARWSTKANTKPIATIAARSFAPGSAGSSVGLAGFLSAQDADGDPIKEYILKNAPGLDTGYFVYKGVNYQGRDLVIPGGDLDQVSYVVGRPGSKEDVSVVIRDAYDSSAPVVAVWETAAPVTNFSRSIGLSIDKQFNVGDFLGVPNEQSFNVFLGPDLTFPSQSFNPSVNALGISAGLNGSTGNNKLKAGLAIGGGYGLGSFSVRGGATARLDYNSSTGLKLSGAYVDPSLNLSLPYAYLGINAIAQIAVNPTLNAYWDAGWLGKGSTPVPLPSINLNETISLLNLDSRSITGSGFSQPLNLGSLFSTNVNLPSFSLPTPLPSVPSALTAQPAWSSGFGSGIAYGISGTSNLMDFSLSLSQIASAFGLPLTYDFNLFNGALSVGGSIVDARIGARSDLLYSASVAAKPNVYMTVEGSNTRYEIKNGLSIAPANIRDLNNDRKLNITVAADPIIAANASVKVNSSMSASVDGLKANAKADVFGLKQDFTLGPLFQSGNIPLGSLGNITLFDKSLAVKMSDILPEWQQQLSLNFDIPLA